MKKSAENIDLFNMAGTRCGTNERAVAEEEGKNQMRKGLTLSQKFIQQAGAGKIRF